MNSGLLYLAAGELAVATTELERWNPHDCSRRDVVRVIGLLDSGINRSEAQLRKWKARLGNVQTIDIEAQDIDEESQIFFAKQNEVHLVEAVYDSPDEPGFTRIVFDGSPGGSWFLDAEPTEEFSVVISL